MHSGNTFSVIIIMIHVNKWTFLYLFSKLYSKKKTLNDVDDLISKYTKFYDFMSNTFT